MNKIMTLLACGTAVLAQATSAAQTAPAVPVRVEYRRPVNAAHEALYEEMRDRAVLERFANLLSALRLPRTLTLTFAGCDGVSNAWYDPDLTAVIFCYEYLAEIRRMADSQPRQSGPMPQRPQDAFSTAK